MGMYACQPFYVYLKVWYPPVKSKYYWLLYILPQTVETLAGALAAVLLANVVNAPTPVGFAAEVERSKRTERRLATTRTWRSDSNSEWQNKVQELSDRGFTVESLLEFYHKLGTTMPDFDPDVHTTCDVVRRAIIPMSASTGAPMAYAMMRGKPTRPQKMVTHSWANLFRDLVSAVVADALEESDYLISSYLLDKSVGRVCELLSIEGKLHQTYWICAFSVSQHNSICECNPHGSVDSLTKQPYDLCCCRRPKYFNNTAPLRDDGKSIPCEMNKFTDMMAFIAKMQPDFELVIACDADFSLFTRAWCVAEIAEAHKLGIAQNLKVRVAESIMLHESVLRSLRIEEMKASRPEDIEEILLGIGDVQAFNARLQQLIFDEQTGLVWAWQHFDVERRMNRIGRLAHFVYALDDIDDGEEWFGVAHTRFMDDSLSSDESIHSDSDEISSFASSSIDASCTSFMTVDSQGAFLGYLARPYGVL